MNFPRKKDDHQEQRIGDELYLYGKDGEKLVVLNATAMLIWSFCDGTHSINDMVDELKNIHSEVDQAELRKDIEQTVQTLLRKNLITDDQPNA